MTVKLHRLPDTDTPEYEVILDGEVIGTAIAPYRECGETEWTGRVEGKVRSIRCGATSRKGIVEAILRHAAAR